MDKHTMRQYLADRLSSIAAEAATERSVQACQELLATVDWRTVRRVCCYQKHPNFHEVDTSYFVHAIKTQFASVTLTVVETTAAQSVPAMSFDLIIVPLLGFDRQHRRLGRGSGWYDRFLANQPNAQTIGLAFREQLLQRVPTEAHDQMLDRIIEC